MFYILLQHIYNSRFLLYEVRKIYGTGYQQCPYPYSENKIHVLYGQLFVLYPVLCFYSLTMAGLLNGNMYIIFILAYNTTIILKGEFRNYSIWTDLLVSMTQNN